MRHDCRSLPRHNPVSQCRRFPDLRTRGVPPSPWRSTAACACRASQHGHFGPHGARREPCLQRPRESLGSIAAGGCQFPRGLAGRGYGAALDVLACPDCGGRLRFLATIDQPAVIQKILRTSAGSLWSACHLGLAVEPSQLASAREFAWLAGCLPGFDRVPDPSSRSGFQDHLRFLPLWRRHGTDFPTPRSSWVTAGTGDAG